MQRSRLERSLLLAGRGPFLAPDGAEGSGNGTEGQQPTSGANEGKSGTEGEGDKLPTTAAELAAYKETLRKNISADLRKSITAELEQKRKDADAAAQRQREADEAAAKGDFETAKQKLTADLETAQGERDTLKTENVDLRAAMTDGLKAGWDALPEQVRKLGEKQHGEDDVLGRWRFLHDADTVALVTSLTGKAPVNPGNRGTPPNGTGAAPEIKPLISKSAALG